MHCEPLVRLETRVNPLRFVESLFQFPHVPQRRIVDHGEALRGPQVRRSCDVLLGFLDASESAQVGGVCVAEAGAIPSRLGLR